MNDYLLRTIIYSLLGNIYLLKVFYTIFSAISYCVNPSFIHSFIPWPASRSWFIQTRGSKAFEWIKPCITAPLTPWCGQLTERISRSSFKLHAVPFVKELTVQLHPCHVPSRPTVCEMSRKHLKLKFMNFWNFLVAVIVSIRICHNYQLDWWNSC